jgi:rhodanese-related sulfurtransferase
VEEGDPVHEVDVATTAQRVSEGAALIDVRETNEYEEFRATGAVLVPMSEIADRLAELPRDRTLYLICRSGARSMRVGEFLASEGFDVVNVAGGTLAWVDAGLPLEHGR